MRTSWPSPAQLVKSLVYRNGQDPGGSGAAVLATMDAAELGGQMGTPHWGMTGSAETTCNAYIASPQQFQGAAQMGAAPNAAVQEYPALPNTEPPSGFPAWLHDWSKLEGVVP